MTGNAIPDELIARVRARAQDPALRTDTASLHANSFAFDPRFGGPLPVDPQSGNHVRQLQAMLASVLSKFGADSRGRGATFAMAGPGAGDSGGLVSFGGSAPLGDLRPCDCLDIEAAEAGLRLALPEALKQVYLEIGDGGFGPGDGLYGLEQLAAKYREMTLEPVGPQGQGWPVTLLPIHGADWDLISIDVDSGRLVWFDAEELADEEPGSWPRAFKPEADSLAAWLAKWVGEPPRAEQWQDELRRRTA